jgi:SAM-dependent methyltransferase
LTPYVDSKDREVAGLTRRIIEDCRELTDILDHRTVGLAAGIGGVSDELLKRWESMVARERRYESRVSALAAGQDRSMSEFQTALGVLQKSTHVLRRELERVSAGAPARAADTAGRAVATAPAPAGELAASQLAGSALDSYKYVGFEDQFRGATEDIRERFTSYLPIFDGAQDVLDVGCGRGEFLQLLGARGIGARGLDINHEMVEVCRERGLDVAEGDALGYVTAQPDESLGGLFAAQVIEHLQPDYLLRLLDSAFQKMRPGAAIVLETINPACWVAFFESYIRDITHVRPIHADTLKYLLVASGFRDVEIQYRVPYPEDSKLHPLVTATDTDPAVRELVDTYNANVEKLNGFLFTYMDYAAVGRKP